MSYSLNEIEAQAKKAARGAGLSWGMSEEAGKAVRWLVSNGLPGAAALAGLLAENDGRSQSELSPVSLEGVWASATGRMCPLASGASLNDCADEIPARQTIEIENVQHPLLIVPFAGWAAIHLARPVLVSWPSVSIGTDGWAVRVEGDEAGLGIAGPVPVTCTCADDRRAAMTTPALRGVIDRQVWNALGTFAHRTYAPATEASRLLGAGAGVSDND